MKHRIATEIQRLIKRDKGQGNYYFFVSISADDVITISMSPDMQCASEALINAADDELVKLALFTAIASIAAADSELNEALQESINYVIQNPPD